MKILVTGGLGFIGSHVVVELQNKGYEVLVIDNLSNSSVNVLGQIEKITGKKPHFEQLDIRDEESLNNFFMRYHDIDGIIHFAASKSVSESVQNPFLYYENNIGSLINLLKHVIKSKIINFIFSSSCTVYGEPDKLPLTEKSPLKHPFSPYGNTKKIGEEIIKDISETSTLKSISLRYFNPIGAHPSKYIGELPIGLPQNLVPFITQTCIGLRDQLLVYGNNYPTRDGTCIRDYIYVMDLAQAHVIALEKLLNNETETKYETFNLGAGKGVSVLEVIHCFENVTKKKLNYKIVSNRPGDVIETYADTTKASKKLGWRAKASLEESLKTAWEWEKYIRGNKI